MVKSQIPNILFFLGISIHDKISYINTKISVVRRDQHMEISSELANNMYEQALEKIKNNDPSIKSGLYFFTVPITRDNVTFALRVRRDKPRQPLTMYLDTQEVVQLKQRKIAFVKQFQEGKPRYQMPNCLYISNDDKYEIWDFVPEAIQLWEISLYPSLKQFPTLDQALDDYYLKWPEVQIEDFETPPEWEGDHPSQFLNNNCNYAQKNMKSVCKNLNKSLSYLNFLNDLLKNS